jgi:hypothetical protein
MERLPCGQAPCSPNGAGSVPRFRRPAGGDDAALPREAQDISRGNGRGAGTLRAMSGIPLEVAELPAQIVAGIRDDALEHAHALLQPAQARVVSRADRRPCACASASLNTWRRSRSGNTMMTTISKGFTASSPPSFAASGSRLAAFAALEVLELPVQVEIARGHVALHALQLGVGGGSDAGPRTASRAATRARRARNPGRPRRDTASAGLVGSRNHSNM